MSGAIDVAFAGRLGGFALDAAFEAPARGVTALFGPSGSGKTTVLRCMAGLQRLAGRCIVAGEVWQDQRTFLPPHRRPLGYVFQEASLFPHLSVRDNLLFGYPRDAGQVALRLEDVSALLGLDALLARAPANLSGGERQRVAIGRALLSQPRLLLMDEPLAALDRASKDEILPFLERLHDELAIPIVYVSHDMSEVERLADHLVLMQAGRVIATGPLGALQSDPDLPLAAARDAAVSLDGTLAGYDPRYGLATFMVDGGAFLTPMAEQSTERQRRLRIAARDVSLALGPSTSTILNVLSARIVSATSVSAHEMLIVLRLGAEGEGARLLARVTQRSWENLALAEGMQVSAQVKSVALA